MKVEIAKPPVAQTEMLIRKSVSEVFEAFINPDITTNFWFTKSSGRLEVGHEIMWHWEMYGVSTLLLVKPLSPTNAFKYPQGWLAAGLGRIKCYPNPICRHDHTDRSIWLVPYTAMANNRALTDPCELSCCLGGR